MTNGGGQAPDHEVLRERFPKSVRPQSQLEGANVVRCPESDSVRVIIVLAPERKSWCPECGAQWAQEGSEQKAIQPA